MARREICPHRNAGASADVPEYIFSDHHFLCVCFVSSILSGGHNHRVDIRALRHQSTTTIRCGNNRAEPSAPDVVRAHRIYLFILFIIRICFREKEIEYALPMYHRVDIDHHFETGKTTHF